MIKITNLSKSYNDKLALDDLSFEIKEGSIFGLLGVNGAGKTTLLSILNGLVKQDTGEIDFFGLNFKDNKEKIKSMSSIIPQHLAFYENLTVKENLDFFAQIQGATKEDYNKTVEVNSLQTILNQKSCTLSGGQKRRLNISIGLLNNPKVIYFDEPTVGIDPRSRNEILDSIKGYKKLGITVVYTSHYMNEIEKICDNVAIINDGKLLKLSSLENIISNKIDNTISIEVIYTDNIKLLNLDLVGDTTILAKETELLRILELLKNNNIFIKQINYGSHNLEKYFLDITSGHNV